MPVLSAGVMAPSFLYTGAPFSTLLVAPVPGVRRRKLPLASVSMAAIEPLATEVSAFGYCGAQAQIRYWWVRKEPPKAPMNILSASAYCLAMSHIFILLPS